MRVGRNRVPLARRPRWGLSVTQRQSGIGKNTQPSPRCETQSSFATYSLGFRTYWIAVQDVAMPRDRPAARQRTQALVKGFWSGRLLGAPLRVARIMSIRARNVAGTCRRP